MRGQFLRAWDDSKGIDSGRAFASSQTSAVPNISGTLIGFTNGYCHDATVTTAPFYIDHNDYAGIQVGGGGNIRGRYLNMDLSRSSNVYQDVNEVRVANIAVQYIIKY